MTHSNTRFRSDINGLRAYAVCAVLFYHFKVAGFNSGFVGVDIFFVISGFLMTGIIYSSLVKQKINLFDFYIARMRRIVPVLMVLIVILMLIGWFCLATHDYKALATQSAAALSFLSNVYYWKSAGYFDVASHEKWLLHSWTLALEFHFYLLWPLYLILIAKIKNNIRTFLYGLLVAFVISLGFSIYISNTHATTAFYLLPTRAWEFVAGALVYLIALAYPRLQRFRRYCYFVGFALLVVTLFKVNSQLAWPSYWALLPVTATALIIFAEQNQSVLTSHRIAQWLGDRSYSIYLWHWPVVVALYFIGFDALNLWIGLALILSLILGHVSYIYIEIPTRKKLAAVSTFKQLALVFSGAAVIGIAVLVIKYFTVHGRLPNEVEFISAESENIDPRRNNCNTQSNQYKSPNCIYGGHKVAAILMGDSHASANATGLGAAATKHNLAVLIWTMDSCPTLDGIRYADPNELGAATCASFNQWADTELKKYPNIPLILISRTSSYLLGPNESDRKAEAQKLSIYFSQKYSSRYSAGYAEEFAQVLVDTTCRLAQARPVYLMRPTPEFGLDVPKTMARKRMITGQSFAMTMPLSQYQQRNKEVWEAQDRAARTCGARILNPLPYLCDEKFCYASKHGRPLYYDDDHLSEYGNKFLIPMFESVFKQVP